MEEEVQQPDTSIDARVAAEEAAAAEEAGAIGGNPGGDYNVESEADIPVAEGGEGVAEGFELAEEELIENASHEADANPDPTHLQGRPEDALSAEVEYGEADEEIQSDQRPEPDERP